MEKHWTSELRTFVLPARTTTLLRIGVSDGTRPVELQYKAANFVVAPETPLAVTRTVPGA